MRSYWRSVGATLLVPSVLNGSEWSTLRFGVALCPKSSPVHILSQTGWPHRLSGRFGGEKYLLSLTVFELETPQPVKQILIRLCYHSSHLVITTHIKYYIGENGANYSASSNDSEVTSQL